VIHLKLLSGNRAGADIVARHFPVKVGRSSSDDLRLPEPGVWDRHLEIRLEPGRGFELAASPQALTTINDQPAQNAFLRNGDVVGLGSVKMRFSLGPTTSGSLRARETLVWLGLGLVCLGQIALIYWLPG
jgi:pSer/pThr/pTyr-binding forkhead associated (FHA) protein